MRLKIIVMKSVILLVIFAATWIISSAIVIKNIEDENQLRIASGADSKKGENLDFCYIVINFYEKQKTCGCVIASPYHVLTTARCVYE